MGWHGAKGLGTRIFQKNFFMVKKMNVQVKIKMGDSPSESDINGMYSASQRLTDDKQSIKVYISDDTENAVVAEFTMKKARERDRVDGISKTFKFWVDNYFCSNISFPKGEPKKILKK